MEIILKKSDTFDYTRRRIRQLRGNEPPYYLADDETRNYTSKRLRELSGEHVEWDILDESIAKYCSRRIRELRRERHFKDFKLSLDNRKLGCYSVSIMGDTDADY